MAVTLGNDIDRDIYRGPHSGQMLLHSLKRHREASVLQLGDRSITGQEMADQMSRYVRALEELGAGTGTAVGLLAANRPEVLFLIGAGQTQGYRRTALHPLGSLDDHAYVLDDAGAGALIVDNIPAFLERAEALKEKVPSLETVITIDDLAAKAATFDAQPLVAKDLAPDHVVGITYTGGTTGKPKGVIGTASSIAAMTQIQLAEWEWPEAPTFLICTPLSHAGAAFFAPTVAKGGRLVVLPGFDPADGAGDHREGADHRDDAGAEHALRADGPSGLADPRPVQPGDRLLRRRGDQPDPPGGGDRPLRPDLRPVLRPVRGTDGDLLPRQGRPHARTARQLRTSERLPAHGPARRGRPARGAGRAGRDLRRRAGARRRLLEQARGDRRGVP